MSKIILSLENIDTKYGEEEYKKFQKLLSYVNANVEIKSKNKTKYFLISYDQKETIRKISRYAGRPEKDLTKPYTIGQIKEMIRKNGQENTAKKLGITRMTLYRKMKKYKKYKDDYILM